MSMLRNVLVVCLSLATAGSLYAQSGTATITGTVTDPSGAALPAVRIVARDAATGFQRQTRTNQDGAYSLPGLRPATYDVVAELAGFRAYNRRGFRVEVSQVARLDIGLELGQVTETLEVAGQHQLLTESASLGAVIDEKKILELPLNGRDFVQLALLVPGVNTGQPGAGRGGGISIGGTRSEQNSFQLDGVSNTDQYDSGISFRPSVDAIAEFKIEVNNYSAEFGKGAGGQITVVTKSGTNEFHGALYEFHRNDAFQARNLFQRNPFFVTKSGRFKAPPFRRNEFGFAVGGPITRDKSFFFADYQGRREVRGGVGQRTVPDAAFRTGDFSAILGRQLGTDALGRPVLANQIYDPRTSRLVTDPRTGRQIWIRDPFPGNRIPAGVFDPVALRILQRGLWPVPNVAGTRDARTGNPVNNFFDDRSSRDEGNRFLIRLDHRLSTNDTLFLRYGFNDTEGRTPGNFPGNERLSPNRQQVLAASYTKTFGPSVVNELRLGYQRETPKSGADRILAGVHLVSELGIRGLPLAGPGAPEVSISGFSGFGDGSANRRTDQTFQLIDMLSFSKGSHFFKAGVEFRHVRLDVINNPANTRGEFIFGNPEWTGLEGFPGTGNVFGNFLLGLSRQKSRRPGDHSTFLRANEFAAFIQDHFRVTSRLSLDLGLRYQLYIPPWETRNHIASIQVKSFPKSFAEGGIFLCKDPQRCASLSPSLTALGLGLTLDDLHVDRLPQVVVAGDGVPRSLSEVEKLNFGPRLGFTYRLTPKTVLRGGYGIFFDTPPAANFQDAVENLPFVREDQQSLSTFQFGPPPPEAFIGYLLDDPPIGSFTPGPNTFAVGFQNSYVHHWNLGVQRQLGNDLVVDVTYAGSKGSRLNKRENFNTAEPRSASAVIPRTVHPQLRRLFPFGVFEGQLITLDNWFGTTSTAFSTYHGLHTRIEKRFSGGLTFINSFTWSKAISDAQPFGGGNNDTGNRIQDIFNKEADKGLAPYDHRYRWSFSFLYHLPFGKGRRFASGSTGFWNQLIGGWQLNGIGTYQSGFPITIRRAGDPLGVGTDGAARPDMVCNPNLPRSQRTLQRYFDTDCFVAPADRFGDAGRSTVIGPSTHLWDVALFKNFEINKRFRLQLRSELFNAFNHPNWGAPGRDLGGSNFGVINSAADPRIIQFGLKLIF